MIYAVFGCLWIIFSDLVVEWLAPEKASNAIQTIKGLLYVLGTAVLVYWLAYRAFHTIQNQVLVDQLNEAENLLKTLQGNLGDAVIIIDPPSRSIRSCNAATQSVFGYEPNVLIGRNSEIIHVDHDSYLRFGEISEPVLEKKQVFRCRYRMRRKDGKVIDTENTVVALRSERGWRQGVVSIVRDISEEVQAQKSLMKSEEKYRLLAENTLDVIWSMDMEKRFTYVNPAIKQLLGYSVDEFIGTQLHEHCSEKVFVELQNVIQQEIAKGLNQAGIILETKLLRKDGFPLPVEVHGRALFDDAGRPVGTQGATRDISDRVALQTQVQQAQKMEAIGSLAGGIAHDFNNILGAILGYAEMVQEDCPPGSIMRSDIDRVVEASNRAKELVKQILAFSRQAESDKIVLQPALIIKEAMKMLRASLPTTIDIQQYIDPEAGLILADPTQIHQIITNLCTNAFHAMEETGGTLKVSLKNKELTPDNLVSEPNVKPGQFVEISVGDTGLGIAPEVMDKIFDPFFTTKEVGKGTGMGLAIIHGIAKKSGGFVSCKSFLGEGTTFYVYFPVQAVTAPQEAEITPLKLVQSGIEHILFIDDEEMLAEMGKTMLERLGYRVTVETNSIEALKTIQNHPDRFDLVITDQTMPGMTGSDLARRILQIRPKLPIILCTGFSNQISEEKARIYGIKGFAMKPLAIKDLATLVRKGLDGEKPKEQ